MSRWTYSLLIILEKDEEIEIGKLGKFSFKKGYYVYNGSALGGLGRVKYHLKCNKIKRWHIDYLLEKAKIIKIIMAEVKENNEHKLSMKMSNLINAQNPVIGFGSSDCKKKCESHLLYFNMCPNLEKIYEDLNLKYLVFTESDFKNIQSLKI
jgi:sugar fermentation stimulation protein A